MGEDFADSGDVAREIEAVLPQEVLLEVG